MAKVTDETMAKALKVGDIVTWYGAGKCARFEGMNGKRCTGEVKRIEYLEPMGWIVSVLPDHRTKPGAMWYGMSTIIPVADLI